MSPLMLPFGTLGSSAKPEEFILSGAGSGYGIAVTSIDGPLYVQSYTNTYKFDKNGKGIWGRSFSSGGNKENIVIDSFENVYLVGSSFIASFDSNGNLRWQKSTSTIGWSSCAIDKTNTYLYVCGSTSSNGYILKLNAIDGTAVWSRSTSPRIEFRDIDAHTDTGRVAAIGYATNGSVYDTHIVEFDSAGSLRYQKRVRYGSSGSFYTFGEGIAYSQSDHAVGSGMLIANSIYNGFVVGFDTAGNQSILLQNSGSFSYYNRIDFDAQGYMYVSDYSVSNGGGTWGSTYTRFSGSTAEKTVSFQGSSGTLAINASKIDRTIAMMGTNTAIKVNGDDSLPTGTYGSYTVVENIPQYTWSGTIQISSLNDNIQYSNAGLSTSNATATVSSFVPSVSLTSLGA